MTGADNLNNEWRYNRSIWRKQHREQSPDGRFIAEIKWAFEVSVGAPSSGTLQLSTGQQFDNCNPSFLWSSDSRYLAVPQFFNRLGLFQRQRMIVIDAEAKIAFVAPNFAYYFHPQSFADGQLVVIKNPFKKPQKLVWAIPADLVKFKVVRTLNA